jgi:hypothetical protein
MNGLFMLFSLYIRKKTPQIRSIHNLVNKLETTGSLMGKEPARKRIVLTERKVDTTGAQHETSPKKSLK